MGNKTTIKTRKMLVKSIVIGKLIYTLPLLVNSTQNQLQRLNTLINKCGKTIIGNPCLRWSSNRILNKAGLSNLWHMLIESGLNFIHKLQVNKTPSAIYDYYKVKKTLG